MRTKLLFQQKGAFSPYMYGLLMGAALFSTMVAKWAKEDLEKENALRLEQKREALHQIEQAVEDEILSENANNYNRSVNIESIMKKAGVNFFAHSVEEENAYGETRERIIITDTEDEFVKQEIKSTYDANNLNQFVEGDNASMVIDTEQIRQKQVEMSNTDLDRMAAHIYKFVSAYYRFPSLEEYETKVAAPAGVKDAWGVPFVYERISDVEAEIAFTTPWGYERVKNLNLRD